MSKKIPTNKKYENVRAKTDTGKFEMFLCLNTFQNIEKPHEMWGRYKYTLIDSEFCLEDIDLRILLDERLVPIV